MIENNKRKEYSIGDLVKLRGIVDGSSFESMIMMGDIKRLAELVLC